MKFIAAEGSINYLLKAIRTRLTVDETELQTKLLLFFLKQIVSIELLEKYEVGYFYLDFISFYFYTIKIFTLVFIIVL